MTKVVNPESWAAPKGYSNGMLMEPGRVLFVAGQVAWDGECQIVSSEFSAQFRQALENAVTVVRDAGGQPEHIGRLTIYVTDKAQYLAETRKVGAAYREVMGKHFPAMALVEVKGLVEEGALIEIEATAVIPS